MKNLIVTTLLSLALIPAMAATYVYDFEAEYQSGTADDDSVDTVADLAGGLLIGTTLTGTLTIDDTFLSGNAGSRTYAPGSITFGQIDAASYAPFTETSIFYGGSDLLNMSTSLNTYPAGELISRICVFLSDFDGSFVGNTGVPMAIDLDELEVRRIAFLGNIVDEDFTRERVDFEFTSISAPTFTVPASVPFLIGGLALIFGLSRRSR